MSSIFYPRLIRRVRAILVDSVVLPVSIFAALILGDALGVTHTYGKVALILVPIFVLEPGLVTITGGTIGHHLLKIRVASLDGQRNINILASTFRFIVKLLLGWLSLIFVLTTKRHQALHDLLARSVVIHKHPDTLPAHEVLGERALENSEYVYPARWRRALVILGYWVLATLVLSVLSNGVASEQCLEGRRCVSWEFLLLLVLNIAWLVMLGWLAVRGWSGRLPGCQRHLRRPV